MHSPSTVPISHSLLHIPQAGPTARNILCTKFPKVSLSMTAPNLHSCQLFIYPFRMTVTYPWHSTCANKLFAKCFS